MSTPKYQKFIFQKYTFDSKTGQVDFYYSLDDKISFKETLIFPKNSKKYEQKLLNLALFNLHLILGISYFKTYCPEKIIIKSGSLDKNQANFWNNLYTKGLGEFFYKNKLDYRGLINFPFKKMGQKALNYKFKSRALLPWGGGKDSIVSAEKLKSQATDFVLFSLSDSQVQSETAKICAKPRLIIKRQLDSKLFELNQQGAYNGHVPSTAIYSFTAIVAAILYNFKDIILSNEKSANYGNLSYLGQTINHQYSKSLEAENAMREYIKNYISPDLNYFSYLRKYSELKISEFFSKYPKYFPVFSSCNRNFSQTHQASDRWCGECPKCLFVYSQLAAYLPKKTLLNIFGKDLYNNKQLLTLFLELTGQINSKPFDCVGEPQEVLAALIITCQKSDYKNDFLIKYFKSKIYNKIKSPAKIIDEALALNTDNNIPLDYLEIGILGFGKEGRFVFEYLRKKYPNKQLTILDAKPLKIKLRNTKIISGKNYLDKLNDFDLIIKSPGITLNQKNLTITSLTDIFFKNCRGTIIGVTGTKGKSTTASLIYRILKTAKLPVHLVGNIGIDPLKLLSKNNGAGKIFVYELSSYQLENLKTSPQVAVFINIFPDHLPHHKGFKNYFTAKANIVKYQNKEDCFIFNSKYKLINDLANNNTSQKISYLKNFQIKNNNFYYKQEKIIDLKDFKLLGEHNLENLSAAISVAKIFKLKNQDIARAVKSFNGLPHRLEFVGRYKNIDWYDDAISTTPESTLAAIEVFKDRLETIILGGQNRGYNFSQLAKELYNLKIKNIVLFPDSGDAIWAEIIKIYQKNKTILPKKLATKSMASAIKFAVQNTEANKVCLLSTASPSYSIFKNFIDKGNQFKKFVKAIK